MRTYHNNPLTVSNTKSLKYICGNFTFEALNLHREKSTLEKIVPQGLIRNLESKLTSVSESNQILLKAGHSTFREVPLLQPCNLP